MSALSYPPESLFLLKQALRHAWWYKSDLRTFLRDAGVPDSIIINQGWDDARAYKVGIASNVVDALVALGEEGLAPLRRITKGLLDIPSFDHLRRLDDGALKVQTARESVEALRKVAGQDSKPSREAGGTTKPNVRVGVGLGADLIREFRQRFQTLVSCPDAQRRGFLFEAFLLDLFQAHDLNPRGSFRVVGEQIDGSFELDATPFLLEAKWTTDRQGAGNLDSFSRKVERRLENTLGLFISLNGFSLEGLAAFERGELRVLLADREDSRACAGGPD